MPAGWVAAAATVYSAVSSSQASKSAANTQAAASDRATNAQRDALERQLELQQPFTTAGTTAVNQLSAMTQPGGAATKVFTFGAGDYKADPGYAFRLKEGMNQMNATAAARGGLISGNALKAGQAYGQEMGSQEYNNAFNRAQNTFQMNRNNMLDPLKFLTNIGQAGASNQAANVGSFGSSQSANIIGAGNAQAAGQIGSANAYTNAVGQGINAYQMNQLINRSAYNSPSAPVYDRSQPYSSDNG